MVEIGLAQKEEKIGKKSRRSIAERPSSPALWRSHSLSVPCLRSTLSLPQRAQTLFKKQQAKERKQKLEKQ